MFHVKNSRDSAPAPRVNEGNRRVFGPRGGQSGEIPVWRRRRRMLMSVGAYWAAVGLVWWLGGFLAVVGIHLGIVLLAAVGSGLLAERGERRGLVRRGPWLETPLSGWLIVDNSSGRPELRELRVGEDLPADPEELVEVDPRR